MSNVAQCGLSLNPAKKEAYLVPRKGTVCFDPSYMGLCKLATDTGSIKWIQAKLVHDKDKFVMHGVDEKPTHEHSPFGDRGPIVGVYSCALTVDGSYLTETMSIDDVYAIRDRSEAYKKNPQKTPWFTDEGEMIKKTCVKRQHKMLPRSDNHEAERRLAQAVQISHDNEEIILATSNPEIRDYSDEQKEFYDELISSGNALGMYVFQSTNDPGINSNLYNSFEKGSVTQYKRIVDDLYQRGASIFEDYLNRFRELQELDDTDGIKELEAELTGNELELIKDRL
jgi:recombinational DNA repair protein RecT